MSFKQGLILGVVFLVIALAGSAGISYAVELSGAEGPQGERGEQGLKGTGGEPGLSSSGDYMVTMRATSTHPSKSPRLQVSASAQRGPALSSSGRAILAPTESPA